jgi:pimeloyl-ACP methyl ester carboxylesterase
MFGPNVPLLWFPADAAAARGAEIRRVSWSRLDEPPALDPGDRGPWVRRDAEPALDGATLVIAKSLGTYAAPLAAERRLPAVWLTPVLTDAYVADGLRRATAPFLLVGGTADRLWDADLARELTPHVLEVPDADHGMYVEGPLARSVDVLGRVVTAVEYFLDEVVWL